MKIKETQIDGLPWLVQVVDPVPGEGLQIVKTEPRILPFPNKKPFVIFTERPEELGQFPAAVRWSVMTYGPDG